MKRASILVERIESIIASLDPMTREAFLMLRLEGRSYPYIAHELGIGVKDVERHVARAIYAIDKGLSEAEQVDRR